MTFLGKSVIAGPAGTELTRAQAVIQKFYMRRLICLWSQKHSRGCRILADRGVTKARLPIGPTIKTRKNDDVWEDTSPFYVSTARSKGGESVVL